MMTVTDGAVAIPDVLAASPGVRVVAGRVLLDGERFAGDPAAFWEQIRAGATPTTTPPSTEELEDAYRSTSHVLAVHVSGHLSATVRHALDAARQVDNAVSVIDSGSLDAGAGLVVVAAQEAGAKGTGAHDAEAVAETTRRAAAKLHTFAVVDDVEWLYRSGRTGLLPSARLSRRRPLVLALRGRTVVLDMPKRRNEGIRQLATHASAVAGRGARRWAVGHGDAADVDQVIEKIASALGTEPAFTGLLVPVAGAHLGPGAVVVGVLPGDT